MRSAKVAGRRADLLVRVERERDVPDPCLPCLLAAEPVRPVERPDVLVLRVLPPRVPVRVVEPDRARVAGARRAMIPW